MNCGARVSNFIVANERRIKTPFDELNMAHQLHTFAPSYAFGVMLKQKFPYLFVVLCLGANMAFAQTPQQVEDSVNHYLKTIAVAPDVENQIEAHDLLTELLRRKLLKPEIFRHPFDSVNQMAILGDAEEGMRLFSWHVPSENGSPLYGCVIAEYNERKDMISVHVFNQDDESEFSENATFSPSNWPGALYFDLVPIGKGPDYYLLFGWDGHDAISNKKMVDVLHFNGSQPKLGKSIFKRDGKSANRLLFEYREDAVFSVDYYPDMDMIVHEDLGPTHPSLEGKPAHYVPMRSFSGYEHQKRKWEYQPDVDFKRERDQRDRDFNDPESPDFNRERSETNPLTGE